VKSTVQSKLNLLASLGQWLERRRLSIADFDEQFAERFIAYKRRKGRVHRGSRETLWQFMDHLRKRDVIPAPPPTCDDSPLAAILSRYERHLRSERGLAAATVINYLPCIRKFLIERFRDKPPLVIREVRASDVADFILRYAPTMSPRRAQLVTAAFRSFFRFLFQNGALQVNLALSVPSVADRRLAAIPKYLSPDQVERVLGTCNRQTATGRRDYAILLLLARLGLRAGEVVSLQLDDVDWRAGELLVRGKGLLHDRMPLAGRC
jgi:site-specific recombinase XerD